MSKITNLYKQLVPMLSMAAKGIGQNKMPNAYQLGQGMDFLDNALDTATHGAYNIAKPNDFFLGANHALNWSKNGAAYGSGLDMLRKNLI